jgi:hypothetical protein
VFYWELGFMNFFCLLFIKLPRSHDSRIVFNGLILIDLTHFLYCFLIKIFINFIIQYCIFEISSEEEGFSVLGLGLENLGTRYFMHKGIDYRIN